MHSFLDYEILILVTNTLIDDVNEVTIGLRSFEYSSINPKKKLILSTIPFNLVVHNLPKTTYFVIKFQIL